METLDAEKVTIRKTVRRDIREAIPAIQAEAISWMKRKYPHINFDEVDYIYSSSYNRSRYFRNEDDSAKYKNPTVCVCTRATLMLYKKPSLGMKRTEVFTGWHIQMVSAIIHELTHHVQRETKTRIGNELDTTANELDYLRENHPEMYDKFMTPLK